MDTYKSARGRALALQILVVLQFVMLAGTFVVGVALGSGAFDSDSDTHTAILLMLGGLGMAWALVAIASVVVFMTWVYRATANLPALGSMGARFTPSGAVWSYFIPFVNLVRGYQVMAEIWKESQPAVMNENGFHLPRKTTIVNWWWGLVIAAYFSGAIHDGVPALFWGIAGVLFLIMIRGAQKRQDEMWNDLERRRAVPQPTAQYLR